MPYTEAQKSAIKQMFAARRRNQLILAAACVSLILAALLDRRGLTSTFFGVSPHVGAAVFAAVAVGAGAFSSRSWRCPGCSKSLGRTINPRHCPHCMVAL